MTGNGVVARPGCNAKTLYRKFETKIPRNETRGLVHNSYIHVSVSDRFAYFAAQSLEYKSLTDT
jgi:hypothetical protein